MSISFNITSVPIVNMLGSTDCNKDWKLLQRTISDYEIILPYHGEVYFFMEDTLHKLIPGDFLLIPPHLFHHAYTNELNPGSFYYIHFSITSEIEVVTNQMLKTEIEKAIQEVFLEQKDRPFFAMPKSHFDMVFIPAVISLNAYRNEILSICEKALNERNHLNISSKTMISMYLSQILILVTRCFIEKTSSYTVISTEGEMPKMLQKAIFYIHEHIDCPIEVKTVCKYLDVSPQYLIRLFQRFLHVNPIKYIQQLKISKAKDLIRDTSMAMKEISFAIGFENTYYFSRVFRRLENMSPSEYKEKLNIRSNT